MFNDQLSFDYFLFIALVREVYYHNGHVILAATDMGGNQHSYC